MAKTCGFCEKSAPAGGRACRCSVTGNVHGCDHPCDLAGMPRLCQVLGVTVGQRFTVRDDAHGEVMGPFQIRSDGFIVAGGGIIPIETVYALTEAINDPEKIERLPWPPRLTPEELQRCRDFDARWVSRDTGSDQVYLWSAAPELQPGGLWAGGKSCAEAWAGFFPSVQPGQLVPVEGEP